jgi:maleate isomerase
MTAHAQQSTPAAIRIGQIVPSSNVTMETEIPALLRSRESIRPERFTFHSSRMRMKRVTAAELANMDRESDRCALELSDARVDVLGYACLVAIMSMGQGYHRVSQERLEKVVSDTGKAAPVVTSAGALIEGLKLMKVKKTALIMPYMKPLADVVCAYVESEGIEVQDRIALEIEDNLAVGAQDPVNLVSIIDRLNTSGVDAVVLSACVQMPSLAAIPWVESKIGLPIVSAATCTAHQMLQKIGLETIIPNAGALLSGAFL